MKSEFAAHKAMISVTFCAGHHSGVQDVLEVSLAHYDMVDEVPMFGPGMHPGCLQAVFLLEDGVCDGELLLCTELQQQAPVVIAVTNTMFPNDSFPSFRIFAHPGVEVTKDYDFVVCRGALKEATEIRVKLVLFCRLCLESRRVHTDQRDVLLVSEREAHGDYAVRMTRWQVFKLGSDGVSDYEANA